MKKLLLPCFFFLGLLSLHAVAPVPYTVTVMFSQKAQFSSSGSVLASFYTEGGVPTAYLDTNGESGIHLASLRPGKRYELNYYGSGASDYWLSLSAPDGYALYIDGQASNLISLSGLGGASFNQTVWVELRPVAGDGALELGAFGGIALGKAVAWEIGLGKLDGDRSAGRIVFRESDLTNSPVSRQRLYYAPPGTRTRPTSSSTTTSAAASGRSTIRGMAPTGLPARSDASSTKAGT